MVPNLTREERARALDKALVARRGRAEAMRELRGGRLTMAEALADPRLRTARVYRVLECVRGVGPVRAREAMARLRINEGRRVRGLGPRQVERLLEWVGSR